MKKPESAPKKGRESAKLLQKDPIIGKYTSICEYLTTCQWEDGTSRTPSKLSVSWQDGGVLVALNDQELKQSAYTSATTLQDALGLMEEALQQSTISWRPWNAGKRK